jgi:gamma-glutamyl-gamma-aminobutyrate hydrolase PuuD
VTLQKDTALDFPELWLAVYLTGSQFEQRQFAEMFSRARCYKAKTPEEADLVVFAGGEDVNPVLYGETAHHDTQFNPERDAEDIELYNLCKDNGIPMFGVCRGAQFLAVMNGGKLYQDVDNHNAPHGIFDRINKKYIKQVSSVHHQMVQECPGMDVIAHGHTSQTRWLNDTSYETGPIKDIEAFFFRDTCCIGVQGHPEYRGYAEYTKWCLELIYQYVELNIDLTLQGRYRRLSPEFILELFIREKAVSDAKKELM